MPKLRQQHRIAAGVGLSLATLALLSACSERAGDSPLEPDASTLVVASEADQSVPVFSFAEPGEFGTARMVRSQSGVNYQVKTSGLEPGHAYTLWIVLFNDAENCTGGIPGSALCGGEDLGVPDARPDFMYGGGGVAGGTGKLNLSGRLGVDEEGRSVNEPVGLLAYGLQDPQGAEFHLFVHHHGPKLPEFMPDQIQTVDGGCTDAGVPLPGVASPWNDHEYGRRGPNTCITVQFAALSPS